MSWVWAVSARKYFFYCRGHVLLCIPSASRDMKYSLAGARYEASRRCRRSRTVHIEPEWPHRERCGPPWRRGGRRGGCFTPPTEKRTEKFVFVEGNFKRTAESNLQIQANGRYMSTRHAVAWTHQHKIEHKTPTKRRAQAWSAEDNNHSLQRTIVQAPPKSPSPRRKSSA